MTVHRRGAAAEKKKSRRRDKRPCRSAPATPTGVTLAFGRKWADHRIHWRGVTRWTAVTADTAGRAIAVERYEVQIRQTDASGVPTELDGGDDTYWTRWVPADDPQRVAFPELHKPKSRWYQTRVRALNRVAGNRCYSAWSAWTSPAQPSGTPTGPPAPTGVAVTTSRTNEPTKGKPFTAKVVANEVPNWTPTDGDEEDGASHYLVQLAVSNDGGSTTANTREKVVAADTSLSTFSAEFPALRRGRHVRARIRSFWGETPGAFSAWTSWRAVTTDVGAGPNVPANVVTTKPKPGVLVTTWDAPAVGEDVDEYRVRVYRGAELRETQYVKNRRHRYDVPDEDRGTSHRVKVVAIDEAGNLSSEVDPGTDTTEGGHVSGEIIQAGTLSGPLQFGNGQISVDGTIELPEVEASGFQTPAVNQATYANGLSGNASEAWLAKTKVDSLLLAWVVAQTASTPPTFTTPAGWTEVGTTTQGAIRGTLYKIEASPSRSGTETVTISANTGWSLSLVEVTGAEVQDRTASSSGSSTSASTGTTATTTQAAEMFLAFWGWSGALSSNPADAPTNGFTEVLQQSAHTYPHQAVAAKAVTATGTASSAVTLLGSVPWVGRVVTFKAKAAAATIPTPDQGNVGLYSTTLGGASRLAYKGDDGVARILGAQIGFAVGATGTPSHTASGSFQTVPMVTAEYNDLTMFDLTADQFTVPAGFAGRWLLEGRVGFANDATGNRQLRMMKNPAGTAVELDWTIESRPGNGVNNLGIARAVTLAEGDVVRLEAFQNSGGNLAYDGGSISRHRFAATFLGPGG